MNKTLSKAFMTRSRLRNKFLINPISPNGLTYKRYRNFCTRLVRKEEKTLYHKLITDKKKFWKTVKPLFSEKIIYLLKLLYWKVTKWSLPMKKWQKQWTLFFSNVTKKLDIQGFSTNDFIYDLEINPTDNIVVKFRDHPSIFKIKEVLPKGSVFHFTASSETNILDKIKFEY